MNALVSVIIPVYRVERWLRKCIESVCGQTYTNLEILLIDDGSPDRCPEICEEYAGRDPRIRVVHQINGGLSAARNAGLDMARGDYIVFIDSDDWIDRQMIERLYWYVEQEQADLAVGRILLVDENGELCKWKESSPCKEEGCEIVTGPEALQGLTEMDIAWSIVCNKLFRRSLWEGYRFPTGMTHEDEYVIHRILYRCTTIVCIAEATYYYVQRKDSIMADITIKKRMDRMKALIERLSFFEEKELENLLFAQDRICLWEAEGIQRQKPDGADKTRFRELLLQYGCLHNRIVKRVHYPILKRIQTALYLWLYKL